MKLEIFLKSQDRFYQTVCDVNQDPSIQLGVVLFEPIKIAVSEKKYLLEKLQDHCDDFSMDKFEIMIKEFTMEQRRGQFEFIAKLEFDEEINYLLEGIESLLSDHRAVKEDKIQRLHPMLKILTSEKCEIVEQASRHFHLPIITRGDRLVFSEKIGLMNWVESSEITRFIY